MDRRIEEITTGFQRLLKGVESSFIAKVLKDNGTLADVEDLNGTQYLQVRKIATDGSTGILFKLKEQSFVIVSRLSNSDELFVSMMSEIEGITITSGNTTIEVYDNGNIKLNGGQNGGLSIIEKLVEKINRIEDKLKIHQHGYTNAAGFLVSTSPAVGLLPPNTTLVFQNTEQTEIENPKIQH